MEQEGVLEVDSFCPTDDSGDCHDRQLEEEDEPSTTTTAAAALAFVPFGEGEVEDKDATTQVVLGKWPLIYVILIVMLFWIILVIATPYVLTGETYGRREDDFGANSVVDQQDVLLLLSWLLGEASDDPSCLERVVCLTPAKSSRYIYVSSMIFKLASVQPPSRGPAAAAGRRGQGRLLAGLPTVLLPDCSRAVRIPTADCPRAVRIPTAASFPT
ncbi:hypothetical protein C7M84_010287 [Penaeus vannamei]|uniref:Uncharacterized protein n=1 Tax=Penaeus vannamei TaxID=6689 RepID=A0A423T4P6_PENVA|nr:hypothetical protein C7M84_010287 [Penaeus vannamei]